MPAGRRIRGRVGEGGGVPGEHDPEEPAPAERLEDQVDDILDLLVSGYDDEELPLRREHAEHQAVVRHGGDLQGWAASQDDLAEVGLTQLPQQDAAVKPQLCAILG